MFNKKKLIILFSFLIISLICPILSQANNQIDFNSAQNNILHEFKNNSVSLQINWNKQNNIPKWTKINNLKIKWQDNDFQNKTFQFLEEYKDLYKIKNPKKELKVTKQKKDDLGITHVTSQ